MSLLQNIISTDVENNHQLQLRSLVHLEVNPVPSQRILLITWSNVVIVAQLISRTNAQLIESPASNVIELVIMPLNAELAVLTLPKVQGNLPGFGVDAEHHPVVEDSFQKAGP